MDALNERPEVLIDWFDDFSTGGDRNPFRWLSNFYVAPVRWGGFVYETSEHAFAAAKVDFSGDPEEAADWFDSIATAPGPGAAKSLGRLCPLREDWETVKFEVMREIVRAKFTQHDDLADALLDTGKAYLQEGTYWGDRVWGVDLTAPASHPLQRPGTNWLGLILMAQRAEFLLRRGY